MCGSKWVKTLAGITCMLGFVGPLQAFTNTTWERFWDVTVDGRTMSGAYSGGMSYSAPSFTDIDGDADLDLFLGNQAGTVWFYENAGTYQHAVWLKPDETYNNILVDAGSLGRFSAPAFADADLDGDLDMFVGEFGGNINFFRNLGTASDPEWAPRENLKYYASTNASPVDIYFALFGLFPVPVAPTFADIDADGDPDLFAGTGLGTLVFYENLPGPTGFMFVPRSSNFAGVSLGTGEIPTPTFADVDGDGDQDLFHGNNGGLVIHYENIGSSNAPAWGVGDDIVQASVYASSVPTSADVDGDGDVDFFVGAFNGTLTLYENAGDKYSFRNEKVVLNYNTMDIGSHFTSAPCDIDADGDVDLLIGEGFGGVLLSRNIGTPNTVQWRIGTTNFSGYDALRFNNIDTEGLAAPAVVDIDGDSDLDLFVGSTNGTIAYYRNSGLPSLPIWDPPVSNYADVAVSESSAPVFGDLDGDLDADMLLGGIDGMLLYVQNTGTVNRAVWAPPVQNYAGIDVGEFSAPYLYDLDRDGDLDLFVGAGDGFVHAWENLGSPTATVWSAEIPALAGLDVGSKSRPVFFDQDADGDGDFFVSEEEGGINALRNQSPALQVSPVSSTLPVGGTHDFDVSGALSLSWSIIRNRSGATIDAQTGLYQTGPRGSGVSAEWPALQQAIPDHMWQLENVQEARLSGGSHTSIFMDEHNTPHVSYYNFLSRELIYVVKSNEQWHVEVVLGDVSEVLSTSIKVGGDGVPYIAFYDGDAGAVRMGVRTGLTWQVETVFPSGPLGSHFQGGMCSLALDSSNVPHVALYNLVLKDLIYAVKTGPTWQSETVDSIGSVGYCNSLALDSQNRPHISYRRGGLPGSLNYATQIGTNWTVSVVDTLGVPGVCTSIALTSNDAVRIVHRDQDSDTLLMAYPGTNGWAWDVIDSAGPFAYTLSFAIDNMGRYHVCYQDLENHDLRYALGVGTNWYPRGVDSLNETGYYPSIDVDSQGHPHICYIDGTRLRPRLASFSPTHTGEVYRLSVNQHMDIEEINLVLAIDHDVPGQVRATLQSPSGTRVQLLNGSATNVAIRQVFGDGFAVPDGPGGMADLVAEDAHGEWSLELEDTLEGGLGVLVEWGVVINGGIPAIDIIEARDANGVRGRAVVNVISSNEVAAAGKAIIVAGGKSLDDPVWLATDYLADKAYRTLRHRGFSRDNIQYLSFQPLQDADGNGFLDDISGTSTLQNVSAAVTNWVPNIGRRPESLFVYLCDHGSDAAGQGYFRLNTSENLDATQLDDWLDALQDAHAIDVTVIMDFCYSGSFLDQLTYDGVARRTVIASTSDQELTYFIAGGIVSFSEVLFSGLLRGLSLYDAFVLAQEAMGVYQAGQLDDTHDGIYDPDEDGRFARTITVGASFIAGREVPQIGRIRPNETLYSGNAAELWADNISSAYPVNRAWCSIVAPSHSPNTNAGIPVVDVPEVELDRELGSGRYSMRFDGFNEPGTYAVIYHAEDVWGGVSFPKQSYVTQGGFDERFILVAGGETNASHWTTINNLAVNAFNTGLARLFDNDSIYFINSLQQDVNGDDIADVDATPTLAHLAHAVTNWGAGADRVTVFFVGPTLGEAFVLNNSETLSAVTLDTWLDDLQADEVSVNGVFEFRGSGAWIPELTPPASRERILMASTRANRDTTWGADGLVSFSQFFLSHIFQGESIGFAFNEANSAIRRASGRLSQRAEIDDDGDGLPNEKNVDGVIARQRYLGPAFLTGDDIPFIGRVNDPTLLVGTNSLLLWAADVLDVDGISNVWCQITEPNFEAVTTMPAVALSYDVSSGRYEAVWDGFNVRGLYTLSFFAADRLGNRSAAVQTAITVSDPSDQPDRFEVDDTQALASGYTAVQVHSFHMSNDVDWVRVYLVSNYVYDIETVHHDANLDTVMDVYRELPGGVITNLDSVDDFGNEDGELTGLDFPEDGFYLIRVSQYSQVTWTPAGYTLMINIPSGDGSYLVMAVDYHGNALPVGAQIRVDAQPARPLNGAKTLALNLGVGDHTIEIVPPPGYLPGESVAEIGQVQNPDSGTYGNPRAIAPDGTAVYASGMTAFFFMPAVWINGLVRDLWSGAYVSDAEIVMSPNAGITLDRYPPASRYGDVWRTQEGRFPSNLIVFADTDYNLHVSHADYSNLVVDAAVTPTSAGLAFDAGTHRLVPIDSDGNGVPDGWELRHLGTNAQFNVDTDRDGLSDRDEYWTGTDPTNHNSVLSFQPIVVPGSDPFMICWPVSGGITYEVRTTDSLVTTNWLHAFGPWTAPSNGITWWADPHSTNEVKRMYRIDVVAP